MATQNTYINYEQLDKIFTLAKNVFFIGIGGISQSSLARFCVRSGKRVFGYDSARSEQSAELESSCFIKYCSTPDSVYGMDLVIYTTAIKESNLEFAQAKRLGIPLVSRANFLGYIMMKYNNRIGICGMHGKSTTTAMLGHIFSYASLSPTIFCGARMRNFDSAHCFGNSEFVIVEACEYMNAFLSLSPTEVGITCIDLDHPDFFKSEDEIICSFQKFIACAKKIYVNIDNPLSKRLKHENKISYGIYNRADYSAKIVHRGDKNCFLVSYKGDFLCKCSLELFGEHFVYDALLAFAIAHQNGINPSTIKGALECFKGTKRRMELLGKLDTGVPVFEDYAHHPSEISASINGLLQMGFKSVLCIYQPHTFSRSYYLYDQFKSCFLGVEKLILMPTFSARESNTFGINEEQMALDFGGELIKKVDKIIDFIKNSKFDVIFLMGAGDFSALKDCLF